MALDPSIALSVKPLQLENPLNQFAQVAQLQNFQRQSDLANRAIEQEDALNRAYASAYDPKTGNIDANRLRANVAGANLGSKLPAIESSLLTSRKLKTEVDKGELDLRLAKATQAIQDIARFSTREEIIADIQRNMDAGNIDPAKAQQIVASVPQDPTKIPAWQLQTMRGILSAKDQLEQHFTTQDYAGGTRVLSTPKYGGGPAQVVQGSDIKKTPTIADQLAREKFNWEKANPGFELKETENGDIVGVNKRTLEAFPVRMGGAVPTGGSPRIPANNLAPTPANVNNLAQPNAQVIPGMNSVLDQRAPTALVTPQAPQTGMPLKGVRKEAPENFTKTDMQLSNLAGSLKAFKDEISSNPTTGAKWLPTGADTARMQAKYTSLLMGVKDLYTLGALAGPDMSVIESQLTNPASWSGKFTTKKGFEEQVQVLEDMLKRSATTLENSYGRTPKATKESLKALPSASENNPLGLPGR